MFPTHPAIFLFSVQILAQPRRNHNFQPIIYQLAQLTLSTLFPITDGVAPLSGVSSVTDLLTPLPLGPFVRCYNRLAALRSLTFRRSFISHGCLPLLYVPRRMAHPGPSLLSYALLHRGRTARLLVLEQLFILAAHLSLRACIRPSQSRVRVSPRFAYL
jgi:hypothetical protein